MLGKIMLATAAVYVLGALSPAPAPAQGTAIYNGGPDISAQPIIARDLTIAARFWGRVPCDHVPVHAADFRGELAGHTGASPQPGCGLWLNRQVLNDPDTTRSGLCLTVVHEFGHNLGYAHSADPKSVMNPNQTTAPAPCLRLDHPVRRADHHRRPL